MAVNLKHNVSIDIALDEHQVNELVSELNFDNQIKIAVNVMRDLDLGDMLKLLELVHNEITVIDTYGCLYELQELINNLNANAKDKDD